ncbi:MAG: rhodanese-like domain-containing protein [Thermoanaerobaculia bacterium]|nr:rhodanese-like domain-containing protein [Thermoanaerobaculia bacterium]
MTKRRLLTAAVFLLALAVAGVLWAPLAVAEWVVARRFADVPRTTTAALAARRAAGEPVLLLDARERAEFEVSHLPGAIWIGSAGAELGALGPLPLEQPMVVYCSVGWRSAAATRRLRQAGAGRVENLSGSIFRWANEGRPLVDGAEQPTTAVHPFGPAWRFLLRSPR